MAGCVTEEVDWETVVKDSCAGMGGFMHGLMLVQCLSDTRMYG